MRHGKLPILSSLLMIAAMSLAACGSGSPNGASTITLYNGQHEQTTAMLVSAFEKQTGIKVNVRTAGEDVLGNQIVQEGSSSPADVFYAENTPVLENLREKGLLAQVAPATLAAVPSRYNSPAGNWVGVSLRTTALVYNTAQLTAAQLPRTVLELAQPRWKGKLALAPSETDFQPLITAIALRDGTAAAESWLGGIKANSEIYPDNETVIAQVNNGQSAVGLIDHYYWYRLRDEVGQSGLHSALYYYTPGDLGALVNVSGATVLKSSSHQSDAQAFLAFLVSPTGQQIIAHSHSYEYPLRPGVSPAAVLPPLQTLHPAVLPLSSLGDGRAALELEQKLGLL